MFRFIIREKDVGRPIPHISPEKGNVVILRSKFPTTPHSAENLACFQWLLIWGEVAV